VADSFSHENPRADENLLSDFDHPIPIHRYFFEIDQDALRSLVTGDYEGHANFVDGFWLASDHRSGNLKTAAQTNLEQPQNRTKPTEVCSDVDWMKMDKRFFLDTHFYAAISMVVSAMWPSFYNRPPIIVPHSKLVSM
jgi:hypothetical protein